MKMNRSALRHLCLAVPLSLVLALQLSAQKTTKPPKQFNVQGTVANMDKSKMTMTLQSGNARRDVIYSADTKFMYGHSKDNKPGSVDQVKDKYFVSCSGTFEGGKVQLNAKTCVYRETK